MELKNPANGLYAAFILQHPVLVAGALLLRLLPLNADIKFALLAAVAVAALSRSSTS